MDNRCQQGSVLASFDVAKFCAAILVVAIHTHPFHGGVDYWFTCICRLAVPFFFASSSFFFWRNPNRSIKKYIKRIMGIYSVWFVLELPFVLRRFFLSSDLPVFKRVFNFSIHFLLGNTFYVSWYLMASVIAMGIVYCLSKKLSTGWILLISGCFYVVCLLSSSYYYLTTAFPHQWIQYLVSNGINLENSFFAALIFVVIGKIVAENVSILSAIRLDRVRLCLLCVAILSILEIGFMANYVRYSDAFVSLPLIISVILVFLLNIHITIPVELSRSIRNISILVYLLHPVIQAKALPVLGMSFHGKKAFIVVVVLSIIASFLIIRLSEKFRVFKLLY